MKKLNRIIKESWKPLRNISLAGALAGMVGCSVYFSHSPTTLTKIPSTIEEQKIEQSRLENESYNLRYRTNVHKKMELLREFGVTEVDFKVLDDIIDEAKNRINPGSTEEEATHILKTIHNLLQEVGFRYRKTDYLHEGLKIKEDGKRYLDCDTFSEIYLAIGEVLNLPLKAVYMIDGKDCSKSHVFLRWYLNDGSYFNWEATSGRKKSDQECQRRMHITEYHIRNGHNIKEMSYDGYLQDFYHFFPPRYDDIDKAIASFVRVVKQDTNNIGALRSLGNLVSSGKRNTDASIFCFERLTKKQPEHGWWWRYLGDAWKIKGDLEKAEKYFIRATEVDPENKFHYEHLTRFLFKKKDYDGVIEHSKKMIKHNPEMYKPYFNIGNALVEKGDGHKAMQYYHKATELNKDGGSDFIILYAQKVRNAIKNWLK